MNTVRHILQIKGFDVWSITPGQTVLEALRMMADKGVGALVVLEGDALVGILSERDYARKVILHGKSSRDTPVREIMSAPVFTVHPDQTLEEAQQLMVEKHVRHLPVMEDGQLIGVISSGDVLRHIIYRQRKALREMEDRARKGGSLLSILL
mgnify:FL=1